MIVDRGRGYFRVQKPLPRCPHDAGWIYKGYEDEKRIATIGVLSAMVGRPASTEPSRSDVSPDLTDKRG